MQRITGSNTFVNLVSSYEDEGALMLKSMDTEALIKGRKAEPIGTKKTWGGKEYMKTASGWKPVGKHGGAVKAAHDTLHGSSEKKVSMLDSDKDLKGTSMDGRHGLKTRERYLKEEVKDRYPADVATEDHKSYVEDGIKDGLFKRMIEQGRMTFNDAKTVIESAGLEVPKDLSEKKEEGSEGKGGKLSEAAQKLYDKSMDALDAKIKFAIDSEDAAKAKNSAVRMLHQHVADNADVDTVAAAKKMLTTIAEKYKHVTLESNEKGSKKKEEGSKEMDAPKGATAAGIAAYNAVAGGMSSSDFYKTHKVGDYDQLKEIATKNGNQKFKMPEEPAVEFSRIGKTKSGKTIYNQHDSIAHKGFTAQDHSDADDAHKEKWHERLAELKGDKKMSHQDLAKLAGQDHKAKYHYDEAKKHRDSMQSVGAKEAAEAWHKEQQSKPTPDSWYGKYSN